MVPTTYCEAEAEAEADVEGERRGSPRSERDCGECGVRGECAREDEDAEADADEDEDSEDAREGVVARRELELEGTA